MSKVSNLINKLEGKLGVNLQSVKDIIVSEQEKPLSAAIFGQTGCGKSSLTNAIFGTNFDVDDIKPCTKKPQAHHSEDASGNPIIFWDLPGLGESEEADRKYLDMYAEYAATCDVVLWAFQADTRTMTLDAGALDAIVQRLGPDRKGMFLDRLSVVITKADVVSPAPWIFARDCKDTLIVASEETEKTLDRKAIYFFAGLLGKHQNDVVHRTFISSKPKYLKELPPDFSIDEASGFLCRKGTLDATNFEYLTKKHPNSKDELTRLHEQSKAVYCSARYNFNLNGVKAKIAQKSKGKSILRINQSVERSNNTVPWSELKELGLPVFYDKINNKTIFNIEEI